MALIGAPSISGALTLVDNFNSKPIDPDTWFGFESGGTSDTPIEELFRGIVADFITGTGGLLGLTLTSYGDTSSNTGFARHQQGLNMQQDPGGITTLKARVIIHKATAQSCPANSDSSSAGARLIGALFNSVSSAKAGTGDRTGDVLAVFDKVLDSGTGPLPVPTHTIEASLVLCNDHDYTAPAVLPGTAKVTFTKRWAFAAPQTLIWVWDDTVNPPTVTFTVGPGTLHEEAHPIAYSQVNMGDPGLDFKSVRAINKEANCTAGRRQSLIEVGFDNVFTNP